MACAIPNFNFAYKVKYDISSNLPTVQITNQSTGSNLANITYWFELITPSGVSYHIGSALSPDKTGVWTVFDVAENIPQSSGRVEFDTALPYQVRGYAKDNLNNVCDLISEDIICAPNGNNNKSNFGSISLDVTQKCQVGKLQVIDISNYLYKGVSGSLVDNETIFVYPADETGVAIANAVIVNKTAFSIPIPINGKGHQLIRNSTYLYTLSTGNEVVFKYKYKNDCIEINCNISLCPIMCGLTKYRAKLTDANGQCSPINQNKINELVLKIAQLTLALNSPLCGFDVESLHAEIKAELLKNECACEDCGTTGNNNTTALLCDDIDIACVWNQISILLTNDQDEKDKLCTLVTDCVNAMNAGVCTMPFVAGVTFSATQIVGNFNLSNVLNSTALKVYYKLHSSGTWILAATLASNAVTYTITGTFTPGELYDFKVANVCSTEVDSSIVSGIIPVVQDACYFFNLMFQGLADGIYGINVNNSAADACDKRTPVLLDSAFIGSLMPCSEPVNVKINESSLLAWNGEAGDYEVSYKLKVAGSWTVHSTTTFAGTTQFKDLSALTLSPLSDYEFRVIHKCSGGDSLPIYTDYTSPASAPCPSAGDFISFNESTGELSWYGNGSTGTFEFQALSGGTPLGSPLAVTFSAGNLIINADYSNILPSIGVGDEVHFSVYQDCGGGSVSNLQSHTYLLVGAVAACPSFEPGFGYNTIVNDVIIINVGGATTPDPKILFTQYELEVNWLNAGSGILVIDGAYVSRIKSNIQIKTGDLVRVRFRSYGDTQANNIQASSAWGAWGGTTVTTGNSWDDVWKAIPGGWYANGAVAGASGAYYKITRDGKMQFRGTVDLGSCMPTPYGYPTGGYSSAAINFLNVDAGIYAGLNANTLSSGDADAFSLSVAGVVNATTNAFGRFVSRLGNAFTAVFTTANSAATVTNGILIPLGGIKID